MTVAQRARELRRQVENALGSGELERHQLEVELPDGGVLVGEVDVYDQQRVVGWTASAHDRAVHVSTSLEVLALTVAHPEVRWRALRVFRSGRSMTTRTWAVPGEDPGARRDRALRGLDELVGLRRRGLREPLPLLFKGAMAMLGKFKDGPPSPATLLFEGEKSWARFDGLGESGEPAIRYCFDASYEELARLPVQPGDPQIRFDAGGSRLLTYSIALLEGLCALDDAEGAR